MENTRKLWLGLAALLVASFSVLLWLGSEIYREKPPVPAAFVGPDGTVLYTREDHQTGREVWQSIGGMQLGSIWGHGAYVAPDWSADWLHREAVAVEDPRERVGQSHVVHALDHLDEIGRAHV